MARRFGLNEKITYFEAQAIAPFIIIAVFLFILFPQFLIIFLVSVFLIGLFVKGLDYFLIPTEKVNRRKEILLLAGPFLAPYKDIWKDLKLSNNYCSLSLGKDGVMITGEEKGSLNRSFRVVSSKVHDYSEVWDMFCLAFDHNCTYDDLIAHCNSYKLTIIENDGFAQEAEKIVPKSEETKLIKGENNKPLRPVDDSLKLDINNCSEVEMTALPCISIVMAKRAVKRREEICGFKSVDEFFSFLNIKPHIQEQLRFKIVVKKKKGSLHRQNSSERQIDI